MEASIGTRPPLCGGGAAERTRGRKGKLHVPEPSPPPLPSLNIPEARANSPEPMGTEEGGGDGEYAEVFLLIFGTGSGIVFSAFFQTDAPTFLNF